MPHRMALALSSSVECECRFVCAYGKGEMAVDGCWIAILEPKLPYICRTSHSVASPRAFQVSIPLLMRVDEVIE
jgi:hypothetical protein